MKKILFLVILMVAGILTLTGCQSVQAPAPTTSAESPAEAEVVEVATEAPTEPPTEPPTEVEAVADTSLDYIMQRGEFIIGLDDTFAPMGFRDEAGNLVGFDIDLATAVAEEMGVKPVFQPIDWDAKQFELDGKHIDAIWNGMSITPERQASMSLTRGYLNNRIVVMTAANATVNSIEDLANYQIGTQADSSALEVVRSNKDFDLFKDNLHEYRTYDECIMDIQAGRIEVMIVDEVLGEYKNNALGGILSVSELNFGDDLYAVGLRKEDKALAERVQSSIDALIANGKAAEISEKWFGRDIVVKP